jgi:replicative DNA helicase
MIKIAPHSKDSEMMVLGCMLTSVNSLNVAADMLDEADFYFNEHKEIFKVLKMAYKQDKPADVHLVVEELKRAGRLEPIGGASYVATLAQYAGTSAYIEQYAEIVKAKSILRKMIHAAQTIEKDALADPQDVRTTLDEAQQLFFQISQTANPGAGTLISDLLHGMHSSTKLPFIKELQERQELHRSRGPNDLSITGIPSYFLDLDRMINGLNNSNLMILAARPAMGKTALALNIAANVCFKNKMPVGIFSLEMTAEQLLHRLICSHAEVESDKITRGTLSGAEFQRIVASVGEMQKHTMIIDDQPGLKITDLRARARRMKESHGIRLLVVDYLQLITGTTTNRSMESRQNEISEISRMLKTLARELDIPVICLSQLSRKVEDRPGHRPQMSDLRESGSIEQDSDVVMFLLRREYYDPNDKPGLAELIVSKNRHGAVGNLMLTFVKELAQFKNYTPVQVQIEDDLFAPI